MDEDGHPIRLAREARLRQLAPETPPPWHIHGVDMLWFVCEFDPAAARLLVPPELTPVEPALGAIGIIEAPEGWVLAPFTAGFASLQVRGHDTPDGYPAAYLHTGFYSGRAGAILGRNFNRRIRPGHAKIERGERITGTAFDGDGRPVLRLSGRPVRTGPPSGGINHYLGEHPESTLLQPITFLTNGTTDIADPEVGVLEAAPPELHALGPVRAVTWPLFMADLALTYGMQRPATAAAAAADAPRAALLDAFARLGRPAAIVARDGRILGLNESAGRLAGDGYAVTGGRLRAATPAADAFLSAAIDAVLAGAAAADPVVLARRNPAAPLLCQAVAVDPAASREPAALLVFADPAGGGRADAAATLQLMGLTPAEARIAALVGGGAAPKDAARQLGNTEGTVRFTINQVYRKLNLNRQSELVRLVASLGQIGG